VGRSRNYRTKCPIRKPVARSGYELPSKKDYMRDRHEDLQLINKGLEEFEESEEEEEEDV